MDERITPRRFAAGLPGDIPRHWLPGNEFVSSLLNAYTILVPANEAFYIRTLNACLPHVRDETLLGRCWTTCDPASILPVCQAPTRWRRGY